MAARACAARAGGAAAWRRRRTFARTLSSGALAARACAPWGLADCRSTCSMWQPPPVVPLLRSVCVRLAAGGDAEGCHSCCFMLLLDVAAWCCGLVLRLDVVACCCGLMLWLSGAARWCCSVRTCAACAVIGSEAACALKSGAPADALASAKPHVACESRYTASSDSRDIVGVKRHAYAAAPDGMCRRVIRRRGLSCISGGGGGGTPRRVAPRRVSAHTCSETRMPYSAATGRMACHRARMTRPICERVAAHVDQHSRAVRATYHNGVPPPRSFRTRPPARMVLPDEMLARAASWRAAKHTGTRRAAPPHASI
eukprot:IDg17985t1